MNLEKIYEEEDLFPREITFWEKREYGFLFYNEGNKDSYDSNHAVIYKNRISDLNQVLDDIIKFYIKKGLKPVIYQSISDEGYFEDIKNILSDYGFESWSESQRYMVLSELNTIMPNTKITVQKISEWQEIYGPEIFEKAGEPWEIEHRNIGVGRALINSFVEYCKVNQIENCFLWPGGETAERIYYEAGFRYVETKQAGRASYVKRISKDLQ